MRILLKIKKILAQPNLMFLYLLNKTARLFPDKLFLELKYRLVMGYNLDLNNPQTFNEKLQWLKLYNRKAEYTTMVDKYAVKEYVANKIGRKYIIPTLALYEKPEDIDWDTLPNHFVLKTTHGGGGSGVIICRDKKQLDIYEAKKKLQKSMRSDIYINSREWPYKNVKHRIIAEEYMADSNGELPDYKFYCFHGKMEFMFIATGRYSGKKTFDYYDKEFNKLPFQWGAPSSSSCIEKPSFFDEMKLIAEKLADGLPHVRIDLFYANSNIYFGEITFFDGSGLTPFDPKEWDYKVGELLDLNQITPTKEYLF